MAKPLYAVGSVVWIIVCIIIVASPPVGGALLIGLIVTIFVRRAQHKERHRQAVQKHYETWGWPAPQGQPPIEHWS